MWFTSILSVIVWGRLCSQNPGLQWRASLSERVQAPGSWSIFRLESKFHKISFKICNYQRNIATPFDSTSFFQCFQSQDNMTLVKVSASWSWGHDEFKKNSRFHVKLTCWTVFMDMYIDIILLWNDHLLQFFFRASVESHVTNRDNIPDIIVTIANNDLDFIIR